MRIRDASGGRWRLPARAAAAVLGLWIVAGQVACSEGGGEGGGGSGGSRDAAQTDGGADAGGLDVAGRDAGEADAGEADAGEADAGSEEFDDHSHGPFAEVEALRDFVVGGGALQQAKFVLAAFAHPDERQTLFLEPDFYVFHDEWYWFRLLNGRSVPGADAAPVPGLRFDTVEAVRQWARLQPELPLDLRFLAGGRLYSPRFYELGLRDPHELGLGGLLRLPPDEERGLPERWLFELEYSDAVSHERLVVFFEALAGALPAEVATELRWIVRSPAQETLAQRMEAEHLAYWDRIARYSELARPGEAEVYTPGLTAGRLRAVRSGEAGLEEAGPKDVLVLEEVPDWLPPAAGLITAVPQTPLAHINILARNRGIPNAYLGGVLDDPDLAQRARARAAVLVHAELPDQLTVLPITEGQYGRYLNLSKTPPIAIAPLDPAELPYLVDLEGRPLADMEALRPWVGGKSAGTLALLTVLGDAPTPVAAVHRPLAITLRAYAEHMAALRPRIDALLADNDFAASATARLLVLEGQAGVAARHGDEAAVETLRAFLRDRPPGDLLGDTVRSGGLTEMIRRQPVPAPTLAALQEGLRSHYADLHALQGLRFRSSSTVEDIEGFNGAGLYASHTGFLFPEQQPGGGRDRSVADALRRTWASYWGAEAFEERLLAGVDHRLGYMAVTVHPRFADELERANGVFTLTLLPPGGEHAACMDLNLQAGSLSVANPETGAGVLPEVDLVCQGSDRAGPIHVERVRPSSEVPPGQWVLDEDELAQVFSGGRAVAEAWLGEANRELGAARQAHSLVLDLELKWLAAGWPRLVEGAPLPGRLVIKQVRTLEPSLSRVPEEVRARPFPRDLLARARRVERITCDSAAFTLITYEAYTDATLAPDQGYAEAPFNALTGLLVRRDLPGLGLQAGGSAGVDHREYAAVEHPVLDGQRWSLVLRLTAAAAERTGLEQIEVSTDGAWRLSRGELGARGDGLVCDRAVLHSSPQDYLLDLLRAAEHE